LKKKTARIVTAVVLTLIAAIIILVNAPPLTDCKSEIPANPKEYRVQAIQTVAQPWLGPHHVYGIFMIPERYKYDHLYSAVLMIQGFETHFTAGSSEDEDSEAEIGKPGHYIKRVNISTRTALWLLLTGRFGDLRMSCHWWLVLVDRGWKPTGKPQ
jgi:hypothetical protein